MLTCQEDKDHKDHQDHQNKYQDKNQEINNNHQCNNHQQQNNWLKLFRQCNNEFSSWEQKLKQED